MRPRVRPFGVYALALSGLVFFGLGMMTITVLRNVVGNAGQWLRNPFAFSTTATPSGAVVLEQVQRLNRLESCRYNGQVIVRGETKGVLPVWVAGDRMLFVGHGEAVAGVDLSHLEPGDVQVDKDTVTLHLPPAEILHTRLDNNQSEVYERQTGLLSRPDSQLETKVRQEAEAQLRQAALQNGVLETAATNAQDALRRQLLLLGLRQVSFI